MGGASSLTNTGLELGLGLNFRLLYGAAAAALKPIESSTSLLVLKIIVPVPPSL